MVVEITAHKLRMLNGDTETKSLYVINIGDIFQQRRDYQIGTPLCHRSTEGINFGKLTFVIASGAPFQVVQINRVSNTEVLERTQEFTVYGLGQTDFCRDTVTKIGEGCSCRPYAPG